MSKHINSSGIALNIRIHICSMNQYTINLLKAHIAFIVTVKQSACPIGMIKYASSAKCQNLDIIEVNEFRILGGQISSCGNLNLPPGISDDVIDKIVISWHTLLW